MKSLIKIGFLSSVLFLSTSSLSFALPISAGDLVTMWSENGQYSVQTADDTTYHSFCLESKQYFSSGVTYTVQSIGDVAFGGGTIWKGGTYQYAGTEGDEVSEQSKWLFASYLTDKKVVKNGVVQDAIWWLEGERGGNETAWTDLKNLYDWGNTKDDFAGWDIAVVNIVSTQKTRGGEVVIDRQSQLIGTAPVPEPATMLLFGTGLIGLVGVRLKRKK